MKANEFVKKFGWESFIIAASLIKFNRYKYAIIYNDEIDFSDEFDEKHNDYMFETKEVKRLVESWELAEKYDSLDDAKSHLNRIEFSISTKTWFGGELINWSMYRDKLKQAIADVESCQ